MLVKVDRASMAVGLEVRPVFLHRDMLALAGRIPPRLLADRTQGKKVLKAALKPWLPDSILYRRKQGFALPLQKWLGGGLGDFFDSGKGGGALAELLPPAKRAALLKRQEASGRDPAGAAHSLFFLDRWLAKWM
jgi:asparagine synthase (glutamine-hydrolysing)